MLLAVVWVVVVVVAVVAVCAACTRIPGTFKKKSNFGARFSRQRSFSLYLWYVSPVSELSGGAWHWAYRERRLSEASCIAARAASSAVAASSCACCSSSVRRCAAKFSKFHATMKSKAKQRFWANQNTRFFFRAPLRLAKLLKIIKHLIGAARCRLHAKDTTSSIFIPVQYVQQVSATPRNFQFTNTKVRPIIISTQVQTGSCWTHNSINVGR